MFDAHVSDDVNGFLGCTKQDVKGKRGKMLMYLCADEWRMDHIAIVLGIINITMSTGDE